MAELVLDGRFRKRQRSISTIDLVPVKDDSMQKSAVYNICKSIIRKIGVPAGYRKARLPEYEKMMEKERERRDRVGLIVRYIIILNHYYSSHEIKSFSTILKITNIMINICREIESTRPKESLNINIQDEDTLRKTWRSFRYCAAYCFVVSHFGFDEKELFSWGGSAAIQSLIVLENMVNIILQENPAMISLGMNLLDHAFSRHPIKQAWQTSSMFKASREGFQNFMFNLQPSDLERDVIESLVQS